MVTSYNSADLNMLNGSFLQHVIKSTNSQTIRALVQEYQQLRSMFPNDFAQACKEGTYFWAQYTVVSRSFEMNVKGENSDCALVPLLDMVNHNHQYNAEYSLSAADAEDSADHRKRYFRLRATRPLRPSQTIYDLYGKLPMNEFFFKFGFVPDYHPSPAGVVSIPLPPDTSQFDRKLEMMQGARENYFWITTQFGDKFTRTLMSQLRFINSAPNELEVILQQRGFSIDNIHPVSLPNEVSVLETLLNATQHRQRTLADVHGMTLAKDNELIKAYKDGKSELRERQYYLLLLRRSEKQAFKIYTEFLQAVLPALKSRSVENLRRIAQNTRYARFQVYVARSLLPLTNEVDTSINANPTAGEERFLYAGV